MGTLREAQAAGVWGETASQRLAAARRLTEPQLESIQGWLCEGCPVQPWPLGNATSINPLLLTLGASRGNSPAQPDDEPTDVLDPPTAGKPHRHVRCYRDTGGYWDKIRYLACTLLAPPGGSEEDAYALFGNLNLDTRRSGSASRVDVSPDFAEWLLATIKHKLRPRFLVCLGLNDKLKKEPIRSAFETTFGLKLDEPDDKCRFDSYFFREWNVADGQLKIVFWPNSPSQHPFSNNLEKWKTACEEFKNRNSKLVDRIGAGSSA